MRRESSEVDFFSGDLGGPMARTLLLQGSALNKLDASRFLYSSLAGRHIPQSPERILDAPELLDDYYLNLLDWSSSNVLGVALGDSVYLWNASSGDITPLMQTQPSAGGAAEAK